MERRFGSMVKTANIPLFVDADIEWEMVDARTVRKCLVHNATYKIHFINLESAAHNPQSAVQLDYNCTLTEMLVRGARPLRKFNYHILVAIEV
jgi:DNA-dependent RNA polymerase auxiliary subunit epsilon